MQRSELSWSAGSVPFLFDERAEEFGVTVAFSGRRGGVSGAPFDSLNLSTFIGDDPEAVAENRAVLASAAVFDVGTLTLVKQVHGSVVLNADGAPAVAGEADGLWAEVPGATLGVLTADCVPVLMKGVRGIAAVHAGWRGVVAGVIEAAAKKVGTLEAAWVGPSIQACCYEVGSDVLDAFKARDLPVAENRDDGHGRVAPGRAATVILHRLGAPYLSQSSICTSCDPGFFSFRRDGVTGRQGGFIFFL